jgi:hypothetical protein
MKKIFIFIFSFISSIGLFSGEKIDLVKEYRKKYKIYLNTAVGGGWGSFCEKEFWFYPSIHLSLDYLVTNKFLIGGEFFNSNLNLLNGLWERQSCYILYRRIYLGYLLSAESRYSKEYKENIEENAYFISGLINFYSDPPIDEDTKWSFTRKKEILGAEVGIIAPFFGEKAAITVFYIDNYTYGITGYYLGYGIPIYHRIGKEMFGFSLFDRFQFLIIPFWLENSSWYVNFNILSFGLAKVDLK